MLSYSYHHFHGDQRGQKLAETPASCNPNISTSKHLGRHIRGVRKHQHANTPMKVIHGGPSPAIDVLVLIPRAEQTHTQTWVLI